MKVFRTTSVDANLQNVHIGSATGLEMVIAKRKQRFLAKYAQCGNALCQLFAHVDSV